MFVKNQTRHKPALARSAVSANLSIATLIVRSAWRATETGLVPWEGPRRDLPADPPSTARQALWKGTSVTMAGTVRGPQRPPHVVRVDLDIHEEKRSVLVFGDRTWVRNAGRLVASAPTSFEQKPLSWSLAFGGVYDLAPGFEPVRKMPHPGCQVAYPLNPHGVGFYRDEKAAEGQLLPSIERRDELAKSWDQHPTPAGMAPCPALAGLRAPNRGPTGDSDVEWSFETTLRSLHHAPGELLFDDLAPGTAVRGTGLSERPIRFEVPASPVRVTTKRGASTEERMFRVRAVHVSADDGAVVVEHAHPFGYEPNRPPTWVVVQERS